MKISCEVNTRVMNAQITALSEALIGAGQQGDAANVIEDETRRFIKQLIGFTPPKSAKQGRDAIERDLKRAMRPFVPEEIFDRRPKLAKVLREAATRGDLARIRRIMGRKSWAWKNWRLEHFDKRWHREARGTRGRVQTSKKLFVLEAREWGKYKSQMVKRAGRFKASWAHAYLAHGGKAAPWIERHLPSPKGIHFNGLADRNRPSITFGSASPDAKQLRRLITPALIARETAIGNRIRLIKSNYAKDVAAGIRPKKQTTRQAAPGVAE